MPRDALIVPQKQESVEELELPPENDVVFFNDNTEMAGPSFNSDMTALGGDFDAVRDFEGGSADQNFELPPPPSVVNVAKPSEDQPAVLWFDYKKDLVPENTPVLTWEVKRYKLNKDGRWSFKSSKIFHEKDFDPKKKTHKFHMEELILGTQYRFTVSATNICGKGRESKSSNILCIEAILPNGWFRTKQSSKVAGSSAVDSHLKASANHRLTTSEASNPITNMSSYSFVYYNLHTGQATLHRPELDPYFLENLQVIKLFNAREMTKLREIYDEEILHFEKVSAERMGYILLEVGEKLHPNKIKNVIGEIAQTEHFVDTFSDFMDVMYTFKMRAISMSSIVEAAGTLFSCLGNAVVTYGHIGTVGNWDIYLSKLLNRKQFINRRTKQKTCNMPLEIRLSLPEDDHVYLTATEKFNPFEVDIIKLTFLHLDCNNYGEIDSVEMYRYFIVSCAASVALKNKILTPDMLNQRKKLYTAAISLSKKRILSFKCFIQVLLTLLARDMGFRSTYKELLSAMDTLSKFKPSRSFLVQSLDKYLLAKKQQIYERGKELLEKIPAEGAPPTVGGTKANKKTGNPFSKSKSERSLESQSQFTEDSLEEDGKKKVKHAKCCFCGCRERD